MTSAVRDPRPADEPLAGVTVPYRVRFDECGPDGLVRTSAWLRYAQDVAWIHSERLGFDREWYRQRELAWVVRAAEVAVLRPVETGTTVDVTTRVVGFRKVWARRRTEARLADGSLAMWGHTDWVMTDGRGLPTRVPADFPARFAVPTGAFDPGRVPLPATPGDAAVGRSSVRRTELDPMAHVNNAAYVDYLEEAALGLGPAGERLVAAIPRDARLEYVAPAAPDVALVGAAWRDPAAGGIAWRLTDGDGTELARGRLIDAAKELT